MCLVPKSHWTHISIEKGVATQLARKEKRAVSAHCYGHALNLAVGDSMKHSKVCKDDLDTAFEISKLIYTFLSVEQSELALSGNWE